MRRVFLLATLLMGMTMPVLSFAQSPISAEIAPTGKLRVALNAATAVLLTRTPDGVITGGVGVALAKFISGKFGTVVELVAYPNSATFTQTFGKGEWDIGLGPKTPLTAEKADFIADVLLNEYWFIAAPGREFANAAQVDRPGVKIGVGLNSSSDQFLSKTLKSAQLVRSVVSVEALSTRQVDVWAASASNIQEVAKQVSGAKIVPGAFTNDRTMVILPKGRSSAAQAKVVEIINEAKKTGIVQKAIDQTGVKGVRAAPLNKVS
jgi:polar amino acid transport system substrate-binding protein